MNKRLLPLCSILLFSFLFSQSATDKKYHNIILKDFDGVRCDLSKVVDSSRITVVLFWASWCEPCKKEMTELKATTEKTAMPGLSIVAVNLDANKDIIKARRTIAQLGSGFLQLYDERGEAGRKYNVTAIPRMFIIDGNGRIRFEHQGFNDISTIENELMRLYKK